MSSSNKTTNYELSQYVGSDKPTYLGDYNSDMNKIDLAIFTAKSTADTASETATQASEQADSASDLATDALQTANSASVEAQSATQGAVNAQNTANIASANATEAMAAVSALRSYLALVNTGKTNASQIQVPSGCTINGNFSYALNAEKTFGKLYIWDMSIVTGSTAPGEVTLDMHVKVANTTGQSYRIEAPTCLVRASGSESASRPYYASKAPSVLIDADGNVKLVINLSIASAYYRIRLSPCVFFFEDFGDEGSVEA